MPGRKLVEVGSSIALAVMEEADQPFFLHWLQQNADLRALIDDRHIPTEDDQRQWFARSQEPDRLFFSLVTLPEEVLIGNAGFVERTEKSAALRITIGDVSSWGRGYGTEALKLLLRHAFEALNFESVTLRVLAENERAVRSYEKVGFQEINRETREDSRIEIQMSINRATFLAHT